MYQQQKGFTSLRSKRFLARFVKKTGTRAKKMNDGGGGRDLFFASALTFAQ